VLRLSSQLFLLSHWSNIQRRLCLWSSFFKKRAIWGTFLTLYDHARQPVFFLLKGPPFLFFRLSSHPSFQYSNQLKGTVCGELVLKESLISPTEKYWKPLKSYFTNVETWSIIVSICNFTTCVILKPKQTMDSIHQLLCLSFDSFDCVFHNTTNCILFVFIWSWRILHFCSFQPVTILRKST
jgi:hypothetical protein